MRKLQRQLDLAIMMGKPYDHIQEEMMMLQNDWFSSMPKQTLMRRGDTNTTASTQPHILDPNQINSPGLYRQPS